MFSTGCSSLSLWAPLRLLVPQRSKCRSSALKQCLARSRSSQRPSTVHSSATTTISFEPRTGRFSSRLTSVLWGASRRHRAEHLGHFRGEVCLMPVSRILFLLAFPGIVLGEATCSRSAHGPTSSGFQLGVLGDVVRAHLHLIPSLLLPCRTCFTACAGCPVSSSAWLPGWSMLPCRSAVVRQRGSASAKLWLFQQSAAGFLPGFA